MYRSKFPASRRRQSVGLAGWRRSQAPGTPCRNVPLDKSGKFARGARRCGAIGQGRRRWETAAQTYRHKMETLLMVRHLRHPYGPDHARPTEVAQMGSKVLRLTVCIRALRSRRAVNGYVGAQHKFHDADFAQGWADRFVPSPPRVALFDLMLDRAAMPSIANPHVVELGLGPGYLARHLLDRQPDITYEGLDFSDAFFEIAKKTIGKHLPRVTLTKADLLDQNWPKFLSRQPRAIISTWTLHDLGSQQAVEAVYARCYEIKPEGTSWIYEPGRFEITRHLELLRKVGFSEARSLAHLEPNIENPTAAQNYACLTAMR